MRGKVLALFAAFLFLTLMMFAPVNAVTPISNNDVWFMAVAIAHQMGQIWYTDGGTILHHTGLNGTWIIFRAPPGVPLGPTSPYRIGNMTRVSSFEFNTRTEYGIETARMTMWLTEPNATKNPYGVGTLECVYVAALTAANVANVTYLGTGAGVIVSTSGTGAFANAMLTADFTRVPFFAQLTNQTTYAMYVGTHPQAGGKGVLTYNSLQGTYRGWNVMLHDGRIYAVPPQTMTGQWPISIGTWDEAYYGRLGWTAVDAAKPCIDAFMSQS